MYLSFKALMYMHSAKLVHRDMKPANLLLNSECLMKVADFGLARSLVDHPLEDGTKENPSLTDYVATRWYRAPEILAGSQTYGTAVDLWSLGCIFGEMLGGKPVFDGKSTLNQFERIVEVLGMPNDAQKAALQSQFTDSLLESLCTGANPPAFKSMDEQKEAWKGKFPTADPNAIDLMAKLMCFDPTERITAKEGLTHPYCVQFHDADSEIKAEREVSLETHTPDATGPNAEKKVRLNDNKKCSTGFYRETLYLMIKKNKQR